MLAASQTTLLAQNVLDPNTRLSWALMQKRIDKLKDWSVLQAAQPGSLEVVNFFDAFLPNDF